MVHRVLWTEFAEVNIAQTREMALSENFIKFFFFDVYGVHTVDSLAENPLHLALIRTFYRINKKRFSNFRL